MIAGGRIVTRPVRFEATRTMFSGCRSFARQDDVARSMNLKDTSVIINARLGMLEAVWTAEEGLERVGYEVTFYETS